MHWLFYIVAWMIMVALYLRLFSINKTPEPRSGLSVGGGNAEPDGGPSDSAPNVSPGRAVSLPPARPGQP
jgi:hypothetical protein